jgi:photosystem II stability/assembly factor-like uncharacterized protein
MIKNPFNQNQPEYLPVQAIIDKFNPSEVHAQPFYADNSEILPVAGKYQFPMIAEPGFMNLYLLKKMSIWRHDLVTTVQYIFAELLTGNQQLKYNNLTPTPLANGMLRKIQFVTDLIGYAVGTNNTTGFQIIYKTVDGGITWTNISLPYANTSELLDLSFVDPLTGWVCGYDVFSENIIWTTDDGGVTWTDQSANILGSINGTLWSISMISNLIGFASGTDGTGITLIKKTIDGGSIWTDLAPGGFTSYGYAIHAITALDVWLCGSDNASFPIILNSIDGGINWTIQYNPAFTANLYTINMQSLLVGYAGGEDNSTGHSILLKTTDGGANWLPLAFNTGTNITAIKFVSASHGYLVCFNTGTTSSNIDETTDGGVTWNIIDSPVNPSVIWGLCITTSGNYFISGMNQTTANFLIEGMSLTDINILILRQIMNDATGSLLFLTGTLNEMNDLICLGFNIYNDVDTYFQVIGYKLRLKM